MAVADEPSTRSKPPRRRKVEVIEAAARVFNEKGYESTSIQDIAEAVGILKGSVYYYIDSKEDLLNEILKGVHDDALENMRKVERMDGDALQKIRAFVTSHVTFNAENLTKMGVFFHDFRSLSTERRAEVIEARDIFDTLLRSLIREGQVQKLICPDVDPKTASFAVMGSLNWIYQWYKPGGDRTVSEIADEFADLIVNGLACTPVSHEPGHRSRLGAILGSAG
jgi:TetR/AcrR family transcriptional regulator, cholesterol catabolism regulator